MASAVLLDHTLMMILAIQDEGVGRSGDLRLTTIGLSVSKELGIDGFKQDRKVAMDLIHGLGLQPGGWAKKDSVNLSIADKHASLANAITMTVLLVRSMMVAGLRTYS